MQSATLISHQGIIESVSSGKISVRFTSLSACGECHAKGYCSASGMQEKVLEVASPAGDYSPGDEVDIVLSRSQGFKALFMAYVFPFLLVFCGLVIFSSSGVGEQYAGMMSLAILPVYYIILYYFREKINRKFHFILRKPAY